MSDDIDIGIILKRAFHTVFHDMGYIAIYSIPLIGGVIMLLIMNVFSINLLPIISNYHSSFQTPSMAEIEKSVIVLVIYLIVMGILAIVSMISATIKIDKEEEGTYIDTYVAIRESFTYIPSVIGASIIVVLSAAGPLLSGLIIFLIGKISNNFFIGIGILIIILSFIYLIYISLRLSLYIQACVVDNMKAIGCVKRCWHATKGQVLLLFVTFLILSAISAPFALLNMALPRFQIGTLLSLLVVGPISAVTLTLIYRESTGKNKIPSSRSGNSPIEIGQHNPF